MTDQDKRRDIDRDYRRIELVLRGLRRDIESDDEKWQKLLKLVDSASDLGASPAETMRNEIELAWIEAIQDQRKTILRNMNAALLSAYLLRQLQMIELEPPAGQLKMIKRALAVSNLSKSTDTALRDAIVHAMDSASMLLYAKETMKVQEDLDHFEAFLREMLVEVSALVARTDVEQ